MPQRTVRQIARERGYPPTRDAERRRQASTLRSFADWLRLTTNPQQGPTVPRGLIGETAIPDRLALNVGGYKDSFRYRSLMADMLDQIRRYGFWHTYWASSEGYGPFVNNLYYVSGSNQAAYHVADLLQRHWTRWPASNALAYSSSQIGTNLDDLTRGALSRDTASQDGYTTFSWHETGTGFLDYLKGKGVVLLRVPFSWERIQRDLNSAFATSSPDLQSIYTTFLTNLNNRGFKVIWDQHSHLHYNAWNGSAYVAHMVGDSTATIDSFADLWRRWATLVTANTPGWGDCIVAYQLSNEPADSPSSRPSIGCQVTSTLYSFATDAQSWSEENGGTTTWLSTGGRTTSEPAVRFQRALGAGYDEIRCSNPGDISGSVANNAVGAFIQVETSSPNVAYSCYPAIYDLASFAQVADTSYSLMRGVWQYIPFSANDATTNPAFQTGVHRLLFVVNATGANGTVSVKLAPVYRGKKSASATVELAMQHALTEIRKIDQSRLVIVSGNAYGNVSAYAGQHPPGPWVYDPNNLTMYDGHQYHDNTGAGEYDIYTYEQEVSNARAAGY